MGSADIIPMGDAIKHVYGVHDGSADATPSVFKIGGKYAAAPGTVGEGDAVILWLSRQGYLTPERQVLQLDSFTTATGSGVGTTLANIGAYKDADVMLDVTLGTGTSPTLDVYLDSQLDGTAWINIGHLTQITTATQVGVHITKRQSSGQVQGIGSDAGAGTIRALGWADNLRVRRSIGGTSPSFSALVWISLMG